MWWPAEAILPAEGGHLDLVEMARAQQLCEETQQLSGCLNVQTVLTRGVELCCDCSDSILRPLVLVVWRWAVFNSVHYLSHAGIRATRRMIRNRWVWPGLDSDVAEWSGDCQEFTIGNVTRQKHTMVQAIPVPSAASVP